MKRYRKISVILLSISALLGLIRGYRMAKITDNNSILFPYPQEVISNSIFSNYMILGWILFFMVGVFSILAMIALLSKFRYYAYLIIIEGIFSLFFSLTNLLLNGFSFIHLILLPICLGLIVLGILQTPKEF